MFMLDFAHRMWNSGARSSVPHHHYPGSRSGLNMGLGLGVSKGCGRLSEWVVGGAVECHLGG